MHPLTALEFTTRVAKRAQYEAFEFTFRDDGILVRNESHADPAAHEYLVCLEDGIPSACACPADERFDGACKHRVAVAIRRPLMDAIAARGESPPAVTDGGQPDPSASSDADQSVETECEDCFDSFPCWECVRTGRRPLPE